MCIFYRASTLNHPQFAHRQVKMFYSPKIPCHISIHFVIALNVCALLNQTKTLYAVVSWLLNSTQSQKVNPSLWRHFQNAISCFVRPRDAWHHQLSVIEKYMPTGWPDDFAAGDSVKMRENRNATAVNRRFDYVRPTDSSSSSTLENAPNRWSINHTDDRSSRPNIQTVPPPHVSRRWYCCWLILPPA